MSDSEKVQDGDFITKVKESLNKGLRVVNIRSKEVYESVKIKKKISSHNSNRDKQISELGETVYKMFSQRGEFNEEKVREACRQVARTEQEIKDFEDELEMVHQNAKKELGKLKAISKPKEQDSTEKESTG